MNPADIWTGFEFCLLDEFGREIDWSGVRPFEAKNGYLKLSEPLSSISKVGQSYELRSKLESPPARE